MPAQLRVCGASESRAGVSVGAQWRHTGVHWAIVRSTIRRAEIEI